MVVTIQILKGVAAAFAVDSWQLLGLVLGLPVCMLLTPYLLARGSGPLLSFDDWMASGEERIMAWVEAEDRAARLNRRGR